MPEGHTLHRLARAQRRQFAGLPVHVTSPQGRFAGAALVDGRVLDDVTAHGKHLFAAFGDRIVHVHLGLFGKYAAGPGDPPQPRGAVRMRWVAESGWSDLRGPTACERARARPRSTPCWPAWVPTRCAAARTARPPSTGSAAAGHRSPGC